jgi:hypothetical protein
VKILGVITVRVRARNATDGSPGQRIKFIGKELAGRLGLDWGEIHQLNPSHMEKIQNPKLQQMLNKYAVVFEDSHQAVKT